MSAPPPIAFDDALRSVREVGAANRLAAEDVRVTRADGRVLAEALVAPIDLPPFDNSRVDGFALRHADLASQGATLLTLAGEQFAGPDLGLVLQAGQCARITTGAPLPAGADTVVMKEIAEVRGDQVGIPAGLRAGNDIRRAGEDVRAGQQVLAAGQVLTPARISLAAALGQPTLRVSARPTVAVFTTGDELVEPGLPLGPGQIYDSNRELLMGLLRAQGLEPVAWPRLPDEPARVEAMLRDATSAFDLVLTMGGVSVGEKDLVPGLLAREGQVHFWRVRMKPGMPVLFGRLGPGLLLGLPGNPVSVLATFTALGVPLLDALQGRQEPRPRRWAQLASPWHKRHARLEFLRGRLVHGPDAVLRVEPNPADASHQLRGAADSDVLIVLGEGEMQLPAGAVVEVVGY